MACVTPSASSSARPSTMNPPHSPCTGFPAAANGEPVAPHAVAGDGEPSDSHDEHDHDHGDGDGEVKSSSG